MTVGRMKIDVLTLMVAGSFLMTASAIILLAAWSQIRSPALLWWASASFSNGFGVALLIYGIASGGPGFILTAISINALSPAMVWAGARAFNRDRQIPLLLAAGPVLFVAFGAAAIGGASSFPLTLMSMVAWVAYLGAAIFELWRGRKEGLSARWPLIAFMAVHAFIFFAGAVGSLQGEAFDGAIPAFTTMFSAIHFEALIYVIGTAIFMVLLCKQRSEAEHIFAARHDSMTGIVNRGAFLDTAKRILDRHREDAAAVALLMFDLDHFKRINDTFGHSIGDEVIRTFTGTTLRVLRPNDLFGRYGGEEFAIVLPGATVEVAYAIGERIRHNFAAAAVTVDGREVNATVTGGIATAGIEDMSIEALLRRADRNLYRAKHLGRNRIEHDQSASGARVMRIA